MGEPLVGFTEEEKARLIKHMLVEEEREKAELDKFSAGEARMARIEKELQPLNKMYYAVIGSGAVAFFLLATLLFIYKTDRANVDDMRKTSDSMQQAIYEQGAAIKMMLQSHQELEKDFRRDVARIEKELDRRHK